MHWTYKNKGEQQTKMILRFYAFHSWIQSSNTLKTFTLYTVYCTLKFHSSYSYGEIYFSVVRSLVIVYKNEWILTLLVVLNFNALKETGLRLCS